MGVKTSLTLKNVVSPQALKFLIVALIIWRKLGALQLCFQLGRTEGSTREHHSSVMYESTIPTLIYISIALFNLESAVEI